MTEIRVPVTLRRGRTDTPLAYSDEVVRSSTNSNTVDAELTTLEDIKLQADVDAEISADFNFTGGFDKSGVMVINLDDLNAALANLPNQGPLPEEVLVWRSRIHVIHAAGAVQRRHGVTRAIQLNVTNQSNADRRLYMET